MTQLVDEAAVAEFMDRFSRFYDGLLVRVALDLPHAGESRATVEILAQEVPNSDGPWYVVSIEIAGVSGYSFAEGKVSHRVLSEGIMIHFLGGGVFVDLAPYTDEPRDEHDIRRSYQYVVGRSCGFSVREHTE